MKELILRFTGGGPFLTGTLRYPENQGERIPAVLLIHGTLEHDRDGNMVQHSDGRTLAPRPFFKKISESLVSKGIAAFSWDKRGYGQSEPGPINIQTLFHDARAAWNALNRCDWLVDPKRLAVLGQSAGVYTACQLAETDDRARAYVLQGGLYSDYEKMIRFNYERPIRYGSQSEKHMSWVKEHDSWGLLVGTHLTHLIDAARSGLEFIEVKQNGKIVKIPCDPRCYQPQHAPSRLFRHIQKPALIIHGENDLNVPVEDAFGIENELASCGNRKVRRAIIPGADHSFQQTPEDPEERLLERLSLDCLKRPFAPVYFDILSSYLREILA